MTVRMVLGLPGSGKTLYMVREMLRNENGKMKFSNIHTVGVPSNIVMHPSNIIRKEVTYSPTGKEKVEYRANIEFWKKQREIYGSFDIIIDEAHTIMDSRQAMTKSRKAVNEFLALIRRMVGSNDSDYGELVLLTQLNRNLDVRAREQATIYCWCRMHYTKKCPQCNAKHPEHNETSFKKTRCVRCNHSLIKCGHWIEVLWFRDWRSFELWHQDKKKTFFHRQQLFNVNKYFQYYNTFQITDLINLNDID